MPVFERTEQRRSIPRIIFYVLGIAFFIGIYLDKCSVKNEKSYFKIQNAVVDNANEYQVDVTFEVKSNIDIEMDKNIEISVFANKGEFLVANKITRINIPPMKTTRYRKVLEFLPEKRESDVIDSVRITFYNQIK